MNAPILQETIVLGEEYDAKLQKVLIEVLQEIGGVKLDNSWGVLGSQEVHTLSIKIGAKTLLIQSETYIGISLTGESTLVQEVSTLVKQRMLLNSTRQP